MSFIAALLISAGKSFGAGAMQTLGCAAAALIVPVITPKIMGAVRKLTKSPAPEETDPDLC